MPAFAFTKSDTTENTVDELIKRMSWLTSRLDSKNVKRLDTNETLIKSADGTTYINGPILEQRDSSGTLRLAQGYNSSTDTFGYALYNKAGVQTFGIDSNGNATYAGTIEANQINVSQLSAITANLGTITAGSMSAVSITGGSITGSIFKTATTGQRIQITDNTGIWLYKDASIYGHLTSNVPSIGLNIYTNSNMRIWATGTVSCLGAWDFSGTSSVTGITVVGVFG